MRKRVLMLLLSVFLLMLPCADASSPETPALTPEVQSAGDDPDMTVEFEDYNETPVPLSLEPVTGCQAVLGETDWTFAPENYYWALCGNWGWLENQAFLRGLADGGWTIVHAEGDENYQIYTLRASTGEYLGIEWDCNALEANIHYGRQENIKQYLITPTPDPNAPTRAPPTPTAAPSSTIVYTLTPPPESPAPAEGMPWPAQEFPPYIPALPNVIPVSLDLMDTYSGVSFIGCTEADFMQYQSDMEDNGWIYFSSETDGTQHIYTGTTSLGEFLSIYWNAETGEGKLYYGEIPTLD